MKADHRSVIQGQADAPTISTSASNPTSNKLSQSELAKTLDFCTHAFEPTDPAERARVLAKLEGSAATEEGDSLPSTSIPIAGAHETKKPSSEEVKDRTYDQPSSLPNAPGNRNGKATTSTETDTDLSTALTATLDSEEKRVFAHIRARRMMRTEDILHMKSFAGEGGESFLGLVPRVERGRMGLVRVPVEGEGEVEA